MISPLKAWYLVTHLGPGWAWFRAGYAFRRRSGTLRRRSISKPWNQISCQPSSLPGLFPHFPQEIGSKSVEEAEDILRGRFRLFSTGPLAAGNPPNWLRNQLTGEEVPAERHWSTLGDSAFGDIKGVWELSRFSWAFTLARAYGRTRDERFAEGFWRLFEDWLHHNPPNLGPNWMCGQEAAFRLLAVTFAREVLDQSPASSPDRELHFSRFVQATGERIEVNLDYALSQSNNHGISECVGLLTAATLMSGSPAAKRWRDRGLSALRKQLDELVYPDGGFSQHSAVYHRVLLHDLYWLVAVLRHEEGGLPDWILSALERSVQFISELVDPASGVMPLYGSNDGACILPLADVDFLDSRPTLQCGFALLYGRRPLPPGTWDELADWIVEQKSALLQSSSSGSHNKALDHHYFPDAGCLTWRNQDARLFWRCPTRFRHRPSQADMQHVSLTWRGLRIALDAGTYSYNTSGPFSGSLKEAAVHNTLTVDDREPMEKVGRFLYLPWPRGTVTFHPSIGGVSYEHDGWNSVGVRHIRTVNSAGASSFKVADEVHSRASRRIRLHWLLHDCRYFIQKTSLVLHTTQGNFAISWSVPCDRVSIVRADKTTSRGWWSPYYHQAIPALSLALDYEVQGNFRMETILGPVA